MIGKVSAASGLDLAEMETNKGTAWGYVTNDLIVGVWPFIDRPIVVCSDSYGTRRHFPDQATIESIAATIEFALLVSASWGSSETP